MKRFFILLFLFGVLGGINFPISVMANHGECFGGLKDGEGCKLANDDDCPGVCDEGPDEGEKCTDVSDCKGQCLDKNGNRNNQECRFDIDCADICVLGPNTGKPCHLGEDRMCGGKSEGGPQDGQPCFQTMNSCGDEGICRFFDNACRELRCDNLTTCDLGFCMAIPHMIVDLNEFVAIPQENGILLKWETATEVDSEGFKIWRGVPDLTKYCGCSTDINDYKEVTLTILKT